MRVRLGWILVALAWLAGDTASAQVFNAPTSSGSERDSLQDADSFVSFIDSALPRSQGRFYFEDFTRMRRPTRDAYFFPNLPSPETSLDFSQLVTHAEVAIVPSISVFLDTPVLFQNPDVNANIWGLGNMDLGLKWGFLNTENLLTTFQFRTYVPTAVHQALGNGEVSLEPALLFNFHLTDYLTVEGEGRYWFPIGGNQYNGDNIRYGLGIAYGQRDPSGVWIAPVLEGVGWYIINGREQIVGSGVPAIVSSRGENIFNLNGGIRFGFGNFINVYAGYGHSLTGEYWYKDVWRIELRFFF